MQTPQRRYFAIALIITIIVILLRIFVPEIVKGIFLPHIFKWIDESAKMYAVYFIYLSLVLFFSRYLFIEHNNSKIIVLSVFFILWLSFPTYKEWDVEWLDGMYPSLEDDAHVIVPILFSIEHIFVIHTDTIYILISTIIYLIFLQFYRLTDMGKQLSYFSREELMPLFYHILGIVFITNLFVYAIQYALR
ncbi:MAG: hypothetical protein ABFS56_01390 [Pseudomonadota bacterium]